MNLDSDTSLVDVVVLVVIAQALNVWWSADSPYNGGPQMSRDNLHRYELGASAFTIMFGGVASVLTKRFLPLAVAIMFSIGMTALYEHEWERANDVAEVEDE